MHRDLARLLYFGSVFTRFDIFRLQASVLHFQSVEGDVTKHGFLPLGFAT